MAIITIFSWGYWGWGNATNELKQGIDAAERARGFEPPFFVDIRLLRSGLAKGFVGRAFEQVVGVSRYRWMQCLGNEHIKTREPGIKIKNPEAAEELLDLAFEKHRDSRRLLFFCACEFPWRDGEIACHRDTVARLLLKYARANAASVEVVEWPGDEPKRKRIEVGDEIVNAVSRGRKSIPLDRDADLGVFAGLPWGSVVTLKARSNSVNAIVGPARYVSSNGRRHWVLPILTVSDPADNDVEKLQRQAERFRLEHGLESRFL